MTKHHLRLKEPGWQTSLVLNGVGALHLRLRRGRSCSSPASTTPGSMLIVMPLFVFMLLRLNRQYEHEAQLLEHDVPAAATAPILRRHVVLVFVDRLDMASARAIQYARTLTPDELRAVHFAIDEDAAAELAEEWARTGSAARAARDRRLPRPPAHPRRGGVRGPRAVRRRDRGVGAPPRPQVPGHLAPGAARQDRRRDPRAGLAPAPRQRHRRCRSTSTRATTERVPLSAIVTRRTGTTGEGRGGRAARARRPATPSRTGSSRCPAASRSPRPRWRERVKVAGRVRSVRVAPLHDAPTVELILVDGTASISVLFLGRRVDRRRRASAPRWPSRARSASTRPGWPSSTRATSSSAEPSSERVQLALGLEAVEGVGAVLALAHDHRRDLAVAGDHVDRRGSARARRPRPRRRHRAGTPGPPAGA